MVKYILFHSKYTEAKGTGALSLISAYRYVTENLTDIVTVFRQVKNTISKATDHTRFTMYICINELVFN